MSADRLQRVGWSKGPYRMEWVDASAVVAVRAMSATAAGRRRSELLLAGGGVLAVFGTPDEVTTQLNGGTP